MRRAGREFDGRFLGADEAYRFNSLDYAAGTSAVDFAENLVTLLVDIARSKRHSIMRLKRNQASLKTESAP